MNKLIVTKGLSKTFQKGIEDPILLFDGIDFSLGAGERVAVLGKSGAGKSTFLHVLGTLEPPSSGKSPTFMWKNFKAVYDYFRKPRG